MRIRVDISSKYLIVPNNQSMNENTNWLWSQIAAIQQSGFVKSASMSLQQEGVKKKTTPETSYLWFTDCFNGTEKKRKAASCSALSNPIKVCRVFDCVCVRL